MLNVKYVRDHVDEVRERLAARGTDVDLAEFVSAEAERRVLLLEVEGLRQERNRASEDVASRKKRGEDASRVIAAMRVVGDRIRELEERVRACDEGIEQTLLNVPNLPHPSVPCGTCDRDNLEIRRWGTPRPFDGQPRPHWEIGERLGILDFERAGKITGARFTLYLGAGARLERALINLMLDLHGAHGYREVLPPFLVNRDSLLGTGQLPKFEQDLFRMAEDDWFLVPTAEVPVTNIHRGEILDGGVLPLKYAAWTPCFRREAGSYGKDTRGLIRQHQFNKVELVQFVRPEESYEQLETLTTDAARVLEVLGIPYRVVSLCTGDLGFSSAKTYDIEAWMPGQGAFREISSCSNFEDFQARRAGIRFRRDPRARPEFVHTLNGSGLAVGRTVVAILENFQEADGTVTVPEALVSYMGGMRIITPER